MINKAVKKFSEITSPFQNDEADVWGLFIFFMESLQPTVCNTFAHDLATLLITKDHT